MTRRTLGALTLALSCLTLGLAADPTPPKLPEPFATPSNTHRAKVIGWPEGRTPKAPDGFTVNLFAKELDNPRWLYVLPNGDVLVAESRAPAMPEEAKAKEAPKAPAPKSADRITLFRDKDKDGVPELTEKFLTGQTSPFGMLLLGDTFYVACADAVIAFPYKEGDTKITKPGRKVADIPKGGYNNHWTRNIVASPDGKKLYVSVGSASNAGEKGSDADFLRANILEMNLDGTGLRVYAGGIRNPVGMDWEPTTKVLWTAVNERDHLGDDLVPDYLTSVKDGGFYGFPYSYFGQNEDPRRRGERPDLVAKAITPDLALGAHTASLGLKFYTGTAFPEKYRGGAFIGQRGSWNREKFAGYRVAFVPFKDGKPTGGPEDFLTGFLKNADETHGRPVSVALAADGALLVTDDVSNRVWRVAAKGDK